MGALAPVRNADLMPRIARGSDSYVDEILKVRKQAADETGSETLNPRDRQRRLALLLSDRDTYMRKLGQGMIGPIQLKLRYQGMVRNVLLEDPLTPGIPIEYDILDDLGQAYVMSGNEGEVKVTMFEGKKAPIGIFRIATYPSVRKEDLWFLRVNIVEYMQDESKQAVMKAEDARLVAIMDLAISDYGNDANHLVSTGAHQINELSGYLSPDTLYDLVVLIDQHELEAARLLFSPTDYRDVFKWDLNQVGLTYKDRLVAGEKVVQFGEFQIQRSIKVPAGTIYLTPGPEFLGVFPILYSLDVEENHNPPRFRKGWVMDEMVGLAILNPRGLAKIVKS